MHRRSIWFMVFIVFVFSAYAVARDDAVAADNATLILYYSMTGKTRIVADELSMRMPQAELVEIKSDVGILKAALWHQPFDLDADIEPLAVDLSRYSRIVLCSPIWIQKISSPARTVITTMPLRGKKIEVFVTCAGHFGESGQEKFKELLSSQGIELLRLAIIKTSKKTEEEIRQQAREQLEGTLKAVE